MFSDATAKKLGTKRIEDSQQQLLDNSLALVMVVSNASPTTMSQLGKSHLDAEIVNEHSCECTSVAQGRRSSWDKVISDSPSLLRTSLGQDAHRGARQILADLGHSFAQLLTVFL